MSGDALYFPPRVGDKVYDPDFSFNTWTVVAVDGKGGATVERQDGTRYVHSADSWRWATTWDFLRRLR